jgi:DNA mismatch repair ATPase MutS
MLFLDELGRYDHNEKKNRFSLVIFRISHPYLYYIIFRATSNEDGVAIAWSVAERLIASGARAFFATHYPQLCEMSHMYKTVQNQHLEASLSSNGGKDILYSHKIQKGPCPVTSRYGVDIAAKCGWPEDVMKEVRI